MGGNAFEGLTRIQREDIDPTLRYVACVLDFPGLTFEYMKNNLMGSAGKQDDSGDLDIAMDQELFDHRVLYRLADRCREVFGNEKVNSKGLKADQLNTVMPILSNSTNDFNRYVQVDFIYGDSDWLKFSHWSPGKDRSPFKGVLISQTLGVLAKMNVLFRYPKTDDPNLRQAEVAFAYNLERGLSVRCRLRRKDGSFGQVDEDTFETKCPVIPPRVPRFGFMNDPETVVRLCVGKGVKPADIETFEDLLSVLRKTRSNEWWENFKGRLVNSLMRSSVKKEMSRDELNQLLRQFTKS